MMITKRIVQPGWLLLLLLLFIACNQDSGTGGQSLKEYATTTIKVEKAETGTLYPAVLRGKQDIEIRPRVNGYIVALCVDEGSTVHKGQVLFKLDPVTYQEAVTSAEATVKTIEANVKSQQLTFENKRLLQQRGVISEVELKAAEYALQSTEGQLMQAKAHLVSARNDLSYTNVVSPSDGIVGSIPYRVGSLAGSTMSQPLTIVSDISDIYAYFAINEKALLGITRQVNASSGVKSFPKVKLLLADGSTYPFEGEVETISGVINSATGAVTLRARFDNNQRMLRSGGSGNILINAEVDSAMFIPQRATYELQNKRFVYRLTDSMTVKATPIVSVDAGDGRRYIVSSGLNEGDVIVAEGIASLRDGMKIAVKPNEEEKK